ncbi:MAG: TIGR01244 family sulfur transferase [Rubrivivax sp.]
MNSETVSVRQIDENVCVAPQLSPEAMEAAAKAGFKSVVNNRPDFEGGADQPTSAQIEAAALAAGLAYRHLPVSGAFQSEQDAQAMALLLAELPRPLLMFCRSGARSARLYAMATGQ